MRLFDFFRKQPSDNKLAHQQKTAFVDDNSYLIESLQNRLLQLDYQVEKHTQYLTLIVNDEIEISTVIVENPDNHPSLLQLMVLIIHPKYFPKGIEESLIGIGTTMQEKVNSALDNFINSTFLTIINSFSESHTPDLDFFTIIDGKEVLWHPKLGTLMSQGRWSELPENEPFFEIIKDKVKLKLTVNKFNWLKLYISKQANGRIIGGCLFNNEDWDEGLADITDYAKSWKVESDFQGLKQFIMFRKCDAYG